MKENNKVYFAPQLNIKSGIKDISFYAKAFGAVELRHWLNEDKKLSNAELIFNTVPCLPGRILQ